MMEKEEIYRKLAELLHDHGIHYSRLSERILLDSIQMYRFADEIENEFGIELDLSQFLNPTHFNLENLLNYILLKLGLED